MKLIISSVSGEPIYEQIKDQIRAAVLSGELAAGEALPSLRKLAKELRISVLTVTRAYNELADEGIVVVIANGKREQVLPDILQAEERRLAGGGAGESSLPYTRFTPSASPASSIKKWIAHSEGFTKGVLHVNRQAVELLSSDKAVSILPIGITAVEGEFEKDDLVRIVGPEGQPVGVGKANCTSAQAREDIGQHGKKPVVHYDYLYIE